MTMHHSAPLVCDFARSFVRWRTDTTRRPPITMSRPPPSSLNNVRIPLECVATVARDGVSQDFALSASCKTEQVYVEGDVWMQPNADMCAITGPDEFLIVKRWDRTDKSVMLHPPSLGPQPERQWVDPRIAFEAQTTTVRRRAARRLQTIDEIIDGLRGDQEVVARTTWSAAGGEVTIEYPVKTVNFSERHRYYQVDTGPVLFYGEPTGVHPTERFHLAYLAHLGGGWAEFLVCRPTPLEGFPVAVHHYGETRRVEARNSLWLVDE